MHASQKTRGGKGWEKKKKEGEEGQKAKRRSVGNRTKGNHGREEVNDRIRFQPSVGTLLLTWTFGN